MKKVLVRAVWDDEANVWVATSDDVPGLVVEAATTSELEQAVIELVPQLLALNSDKRTPKKIPIQLHQESCLVAIA